MFAAELRLVGIFHHGLQLLHIAFLTLLIDSGREVDFCFSLVCHDEAGAYRARDIRDNSPLRQRDQNLVGRFIVRFADVFNRDEIRKCCDSA